MNLSKYKRLSRIDDLSDIESCKENIRYALRTRDFEILSKIFARMASIYLEGDEQIQTAVIAEFDSCLDRVKDFGFEFFSKVTRILVEESSKDDALKYALRFLYGARFGGIPTQAYSLWLGPLHDLLVAEGYDVLVCSRGFKHRILSSVKCGLAYTQSIQRVIKDRIVSSDRFERFSEYLRNEIIPKIDEYNALIRPREYDLFRISSGCCDPYPF
ncbi:hypothetical protein GF354_03275 [Candidatus Peregrinibacteria bacterium]|nr:hypothetical protein [Candidatus Peregrinibacteria bacterium]